MANNSENGADISHSDYITALSGAVGGVVGSFLRDNSELEKITKLLMANEDRFRKLEKKVDTILTMISFAPGNEGYEEAKKEFEQLAKKE